MKVQLAEFRAAATVAGELPAPRHPEIALAGRSNVGKSTLINRLVGRRRLARTSGTPGCTRGLLFYDVDERLTLVDLPGYGWARRSHAERERWKQLVEHYLEHRTTLAGVLVLLDIRRGPGDDERLLAGYLEAAGIDYAWVLTKCDKLGRSARAAKRRALEKEMGTVPVLATAVGEREGTELVWRWIEGALGASRPKGRRRG